MPQNHGRPPSVGMPDSVKAFLFVSVVATVLALSASLLRVLLWGKHFGADGLWVNDCGFDFYDYYPRFVHLHSAMFFTSGAYPWFYPAPALLIHYPFYALARRSGQLTQTFWIYFVTVPLVFGMIVAAWGRALIRAGLQRSTAVFLCLGTYFTAWPIYFAAQRGNVEGFTWILVAGAMWLYAKRQNNASATLLGVAGAIKIYPFLFAVLFARDKRWRGLVALALAAVSLTLFSLWLLDPSIRHSTRQVLKGVKQWTVAYGEVYRDPEWDHSLFGLVKDVAHAHIRSYHHALRLYYLFAGATATAVFLFRVRLLPVANQLVFLSAAAVSLPPTSFDYTLCLLYVPLGWLVFVAVASAREGLSPRGLTAIMVTLGLLLAPSTFLFSEKLTSLPGAFKAVCLLALLGLSWMFPLSLPAEETPGGKLPQLS